MTSKIYTQASRIIDSSSESIYNVIADYRVGHPAILPKPWFDGLTVEKGGFGAGTGLEPIVRVSAALAHLQLTSVSPDTSPIAATSGFLK